MVEIGSLFKGLTTVINGRSEIYFENGGGVEILEYDTETINVRGGGMKARIFGAGLLIKCITPESVVIGGTINSVELE